MGGDSTRLDASLAVSKYDLLGGNVDSLPNGKLALFESDQAIIPQFRIHETPTGHNVPCKVAGTPKVRKKYDSRTNVPVAQDHRPAIPSKPP